MGMGPSSIMLTYTRPLQDRDVEATLDIFSKIGREPIPAEDRTAEEWLRNQGANERMLAIADACIANDFGCGLSELGLREAILENQRWDSGKPYAAERQS